jgi:hypothetical protein
MSDTFSHSGLASNPNNWSEGHLPNASDQPPNTGFFDTGTMVMAGPTPAFNLDVFGSTSSPPKLVMVGQQTATVTVVSGGMSIDTLGNNTLNFTGGSGTAGFPISSSTIQFAGTLNLNGMLLNGPTIIKGYGTLNTDLSLVSSDRPDAGLPPTGEIDTRLSSSSTISVNGFSTLVLDRLAFLKPAQGVTLNDGFPNGFTPSSPGETPVGAQQGSVPTLEINNLAPLKNVVLGPDDLTLDFQGGRSVSLSNVHVGPDTSYYNAAQNSAGTLFLSELSAPAGFRAIPITTTA